MKKIFGIILALSMAAGTVLGATKTLVKDGTSNECDQWVKFTCPSNTYAGVAMSTNTLGGASNTYLWTTGRVYYVKIGEDIDTLVASSAVQNGDTLQLPSGTFDFGSIGSGSAGLSITKAICIRGQGIDKTTLTGTTLNSYVVLIRQSNVLMSDLTISCTLRESSIGYACHVRDDTEAPLSGIRFKNVKFSVPVTVASSANSYGILFYNSSAILENCLVDASGTDAAYAVKVSGGNPTPGQASPVYLYNCVLSASGGDAEGRALCVDGYNTFVGEARLFGCKLSADSLAGVNPDSAVYNGNALGNVYLENCIVDGADYDVQNLSSGVVDLRNTVLVNATTSGSYTRSGELKVGSIDVNGGTVKMDGVPILTYSNGQARVEVPMTTGDSNIVYMTSTNVFNLVYTNSGTVQMISTNTQLHAISGMTGNMWSFKRAALWSTNSSFSAEAVISLFDSNTLFGDSEIWRNDSIGLESVYNTENLLLGTNTITVADGTPFSTLSTPFQVRVIDGSTPDICTVTNVSGNDLQLAWPTRYAHDSNSVVSVQANLDIGGWLSDNTASNTLWLNVSFDSAQTVGIGYEFIYRP